MTLTISAADIPLVVVVWLHGLFCGEVLSAHLRTIYGRKSRPNESESEEP